MRLGAWLRRKTVRADEYDPATDPAVRKLLSVSDNADRIIRKMGGNTDLADTLDRVPVPFFEPKRAATEDHP